MNGPKMNDSGETRTSRKNANNQAKSVSLVVMWQGMDKQPAYQYDGNVF